MVEDLRCPSGELPTGDLQAVADATAVLIDDVRQCVSPVRGILDHYAEFLLIQRVVSKRKRLHETALDAHDLILGAVWKHLRF